MNHLDQVRVWDDVVVCGRRVVLCYAPKEVQCPTHGRLQERIPRADSHARVSYRLEYLVLRYCQIMTQKAAANLLHMPQSTLSDVLHRAICRLRAGHRIANMVKLVIDRFHIVKALNAAVDEVRKEEWREADGEDKKAIKGLLIKTRLSNAISEGLNRIIKIVKNRAGGFRNLDAFTDMIFLTVGDVDIPAQIPTEFRTA